MRRGWLGQMVHDLKERFLQRPCFDQIWIVANRRDSSVYQLVLIFNDRVVAGGALA